MLGKAQGPLAVKGAPDSHKNQFFSIVGGSKGPPPKLCTRAPQTFAVPLDVTECFQTFAVPLDVTECLTQSSG